MASNMQKLRKKLGRQKFRKHRGPFRAGSDPSTIDPDWVTSQNKLKEAWGERVHVPRSVGKADVPEQNRAFFDYRGHAKHRPERTYTLDGETPHGQFWLSRLFPGVKFITHERQAVVAALDVMKRTRVLYEHDPNGVLVERKQEELADPDLHFAVWTNGVEYLRLYFIPSKECWWFVERTRRIIKSSSTFGSKQRALAAYEIGQVKWMVVRTLPPEDT